MPRWRKFPAQPLNKRVLFILSHGGSGALGLPASKPRRTLLSNWPGLQNAMQGFDHYRHDVAGKGSLPACRIWW
ncbi:Uncharacterised protein [Kluyvera cryocrescens]|uniref:Uncharacterized protein n=1 Tax=Kluyvera cryocrescens TaxID=580 RepID=A0A485ASE5_KLUCR|nr:Uncharacterised protein [Kluyvera cryocrescens]